MITLTLTITDKPGEIRGATMSFVPHYENLTASEVAYLREFLPKFGSSFTETARSLLAACESDRRSN